MPRGRPAPPDADPDCLIARCPKRRLTLRPATLSVIRQWLVMVGARHQRALAAAMHAHKSGGGPAQLGIIRREREALQVVAELICIASDKWDAQDWQAAAELLTDLSGTFGG